MIIWQLLATLEPCTRDILLQQVSNSDRDCDLCFITCMFLPKAFFHFTGSSSCPQNYLQLHEASLDVCICVSTQDTPEALIWLPALRWVLTSSFWPSEPKLPVRVEIADLIIFFWEETVLTAKGKSNWGEGGWAGGGVWWEPWSKDSDTDLPRSCLIKPWFVMSMHVLITQC